MRISEVLRSEPVLAGYVPELLLRDTKKGDPRIGTVPTKIVHLVRGNWPPKVTADKVSHQINSAMRSAG